MTETTVLKSWFPPQQHKDCGTWVAHGVFVSGSHTSVLMILRFFYSVVNKKYEAVLLRNSPCFQFDSLH